MSFRAFLGSFSFRFQNSFGILIIKSLSWNRLDTKKVSDPSSVFYGRFLVICLVYNNIDPMELMSLSLGNSNT